MPSHSHGGATASAAPTTGYMNQNQNHNHGGWTGADDRDHQHGLGDPGHSHGDYGRIDFRGSTTGSDWRASPGWGVGGGATSAAGTGCWIGNETTGVLHSISYSNVDHLHAVPNLAINADGGSQPHNNMPPHLVLNWIIRDGT